MKSNGSQPESESTPTPGKIHPVPVYKRFGHPEKGFLVTGTRRLKRKIQDFFLDHTKTKWCADQVFLLVVELISAFLFAYGFRSFLSPSRVPFANLDSTGLSNLQSLMAQQNFVGTAEDFYNNHLTLIQASSDIMQPNHLVSGGASGIAQVFTRLVYLFGLTGVPDKTLQSIFYFLINVPIVILGFLLIGKKFTFYTLVNVVFTSLLIDAIPQSWCEIINVYNDKVVRALAAGICTGISSGMAMGLGTSTGGVDVLSVIIAERKSTTVGKYSLIINTCTVLIYTALNFIHAPNDLVADPMVLGSSQTTMALYTIIYFFTMSKVVDMLNIKNKKTELQIFTSKVEMSKILIHGFPHACTVQDAKGGFSEAPLKVIYIVVSKSEAKKVIRIVRQVDPHSFITVMGNNQVFGKFYVKPLD